MNATDKDKELNESIELLSETVSHLHGASNSLFWVFIRGIIYGLGVVAAFAIVAPLIIIILQSIEWVPLIGDFVHEITEQVKGAT
jgi:hypothetical protein